jgi:hypothetical protein
MYSLFYNNIHIHSFYGHIIKCRGSLIDGIVERKNRGIWEYNFMNEIFFEIKWLGGFEANVRINITVRKLESATNFVLFLCKSPPRISTAETATTPASATGHTTIHIQRRPGNGIRLDLAAIMHQNTLIIFSGGQRSGSGTK